MAEYLAALQEAATSQADPLSFESVSALVRKHASKEQIELVEVFGELAVAITRTDEEGDELPDENPRPLTPEEQEAEAKKRQRYREQVKRRHEHSTSPIPPTV